MSTLKPISKESVPHSLDKAERYRLSNEPFFAESICRDVLAVAPEDQRALIIFILALTDPFAQSLHSVDVGAQRAAKASLRLESEYDRLYYSGIVAERRATAILHQEGHGGTGSAWHHIEDAMRFFEKADALQTDPAHDDAVLRYCDIRQARRLLPFGADRHAARPPLAHAQITRRFAS